MRILKKFILQETAFYDSAFSPSLQLKLGFNYTVVHFFGCCKKCKRRRKRVFHHSLLTFQLFFRPNPVPETGISETGWDLKRPKAEETASGLGFQLSRVKKAGNEKDGTLFLIISTQRSCKITFCSN